MGWEASGTCGRNVGDSWRRDLKVEWVGLNFAIELIACRKIRLLRRRR